MSDGAKAEILARVRTALRGAPSPGEVPRGYHRDSSAPDLELFVDRLEDYRATVRRTDEAGLAATIAAALAARGVRRLVVPWSVPEEWLSGALVGGSTSNLTVVRDGPVRADGSVRAEVSDDVEGRADAQGAAPLGPRELDATDGVLTGCAVAIVATGTIVLDAAQGRRALTLVPDYHLCVVRADQVVGGVPAAVARLDPRTPQTWVSGPSATSDIELNRVEGVHGPRTLEVILVEA